jgi:hypothetical protein
MIPEEKYYNDHYSRESKQNTQNQPLTNKHRQRFTVGRNKSLVLSDLTELDPQSIRQIHFKVNHHERNFPPPLPGSELGPGRPESKSYSAKLCREGLMTTGDHGKCCYGNENCYYKEISLHWITVTVYPRTKSLLPAVTNRSIE